jgi:hypothetical protein
MKKATAMETSMPEGEKSPSHLIDARIEELGGWRGAMLSRLRGLIKAADPEAVETWKWRGVPVWEHGGIICTGETYKTVVKLTFARGAALEDPKGLFNSSLEGNTRRAIDFHEGDEIDEAAFKALVRAAVALNVSAKAAASSRPRKAPRSPLIQGRGCLLRTGYGATPHGIAQAAGRLSGPRLVRRFGSRRLLGGVEVAA